MVDKTKTDSKTAQSTYTATVPKKREMGHEHGVGMNNPFSMPFHQAAATAGLSDTEASQEIEVYSDSQFGEGPSVRQLLQMRKTDGQARALYRLLTLPIRSALNTAAFVAQDGGEEEAEFIDAVFRTPSESGGMTITFQRFMSQVLQGLFMGFSAFEKVFWVPDVGPLKGKVTLKKLAFRPAETITFVANKSGGFVGIRQRSVVNGREVDIFIPAEKVFYYAAQEEERQFYGVSFFESAFFHYDKKVRLYYLSHLAAQKAATGTKIGTTPTNAIDTEAAAFTGTLKSLNTAAWAKIPEGYKIDVLREGGSFDFLSLVNHHNSQMSKSLIAQFFDANQGSGKGDSSLVNFAQPGDDMFVLMLRAVMDDIADQINHYIIPQLIDMNFKSGKYPLFTWGNLTDEQRASISAVFDKIVTAGQSVNATPEFVRALEQQQAKEMGLSIDYDEVEEREERDALNALAAQAVQPTEGTNVGAAVAPAAGVPEQDSEEVDQVLMDGKPVESMNSVDEDDLDLPDNYTTDQLFEALGEFVETNASDDDDEEDTDELSLTAPSKNLLALAEDLLLSARETENRG